MPVDRILHVNINVTDLDRSIAFYERLGFVRLADFAFDREASAAPCVAFGIAPIAYRGALMRLGDDAAAPCLDLIEWAERPDGEGRASVANGTGLYRVALTSPDIAATIVELAAEGVALLGPPATITTVTGESCTLLAFRDPDGTVIEIAG